MAQTPVSAPTAPTAGGLHPPPQESSQDSSDRRRREKKENKNKKKKRSQNRAVMQILTHVFFIPIVVHTRVQAFFVVDGAGC